jgi:hypothetical protein
LKSLPPEAMSADIAAVGAFVDLSSTMLAEAAEILGLAP